MAGDMHDSAPFYLFYLKPQLPHEDAFEGAFEWTYALRILNLGPAIGLLTNSHFNTRIVYQSRNPTGSVQVIRGCAIAAFDSLPLRHLLAVSPIHACSWKCSLAGINVTYRTTLGDEVLDTELLVRICDQTKIHTVRTVHVFTPRSISY